jgi:hypothetical protein
MDNDFNRREEERKKKRKEFKSHQIRDQEMTTFTPT